MRTQQEHPPNGKIVSAKAAKPLQLYQSCEGDAIHGTQALSLNGKRERNSNIEVHRMLPSCLIIASNKSVHNLQFAD